MSVIYRTDLVKAAASASGVNLATATAIIDNALDHIVQSMKAGHEVRLPGFGTFAAPIRDAREVRNFQTGKREMTPAKRVPKFKVSGQLKQAVA